MPKLKVNIQNCKFWIQKHEKDKKREDKKLNQTKTSSFSYSPVHDKTFDSIKKQPKKVLIFQISVINPHETDKY